MTGSSDATPRPARPLDRRLIGLLSFYAAASLLHFSHNAERLHAYPNLPESWSRGGVYLAWVFMTTVGIASVVATLRGNRRVGAALMIVWALLGLASFAHYAVAPVTAHTPAMNLTIGVEIVAATLVLLAATPRILSRPRR